MKLHIYIVILGASLALNSNAVYAQKYDSRVANPFVFCKAPKPCKLCHPFRKIYEDICADQAEASKQEDPNPVSPAPVALPPPMNDETASDQTQPLQDRDAKK